MFTDAIEIDSSSGKANLPDGPWWLNSTEHSGRKMPKWYLCPCEQTWPFSICFQLVCKQVLPVWWARQCMLTLPDGATGNVYRLLHRSSSSASVEMFLSWKNVINQARQLAFNSKRSLFSVAHTQSSPILLLLLLPKLKRVDSILGTSHDSYGEYLTVWPSDRQRDWIWMPFIISFIICLRIRRS